MSDIAEALFQKADRLADTMGRIFGALDPDCSTYEQARVKARGIILSALSSSEQGEKDE